MDDFIQTGEKLRASEEEPLIEQELLDDLVKAGVLYGRKKTKTHPRMRRYICATRNGIELIDPVQTVAAADACSAFLGEAAAARKLILVVGTEPAAREAARTFAEKFNYPVVTVRWLGGTLTNFRTIHRRLQYYLKLKTDRESGMLEKYTKRERVAFDKEIERLTRLFGGLEQLTKLPDVLLVVGTTSHETAVREANRQNVPIVAIASTDSNPDRIDYLVPANDRARSSITWIFKRFESAVADGVARRDRADASKAQDGAPQPDAALQKSV